MSQAYAELLKKFNRLSSAHSRLSLDLERSKDQTIVLGRALIHILQDSDADDISISADKIYEQQGFSLRAMTTEDGQFIRFMVEKDSRFNRAGRAP